MKEKTLPISNFDLCIGNLMQGIIVDENNIKSIKLITKKTDVYLIKTGIHEYITVEDYINGKDNILLDMPIIHNQIYVASESVKECSDTEILTKAYHKIKHRK